MGVHGFVLAAAALAWLPLAAACAAAQPLTPPSPQGGEGRARGMEQVDVFVAAQNGYHTYRIPSLLVTAKGTLLAFAEGRKNGRGDSGDIDLVLRRSLDGGKTWSPLQVVWDDGENTCGNPCPVADRDTGIVWLLMTHNLGRDHEAQIVDRTAQGSRTVWVTSSADDGLTWAKPVEITPDVKDPDWTWYATGPGVAIQLKSGRLLVPCDHVRGAAKAAYSHVILSDDHGKTWRLGGSVGPYMNECQALEQADGTVLLNMRNYSPRTPNARAVATSADGGLTWSAIAHDAALVEPVCQASVLRFTDRPRYDRSRVLFSNPASTRREKMTVRISYDEGKTWAASRLLGPGPAAYSCLAVLPGMTLGCLYECGEKHAYERIALARFDLEWLTDGKDALRPAAP